MARKWLPHREGIGVRARFRRKRKDSSNSRWFEYLDPFDGCGGDLEDIAVVIGLILAFVVLILLFPPLILLGIDLVWVALAFLGGVVGRVLLGRPWSVLATSSTGERREWKVRGFRDAGQLRDTLRAEFDAGLDPHPDRVGR